MSETETPGRQVCVVDSLSAGPELKLIIEKLAFYIRQGFDFEKICYEIQEYQKTTALLFVLSSMKNLANNGRVSPIVAKAAGILGIRVIAKATVGEIESLHKARGEGKALEVLVESMKEIGYGGGAVRIAHCLNEGAALALRERLLADFPQAEVEICTSGGLCSFYAERGGLLVGFEKGR